jgi:hypothetical protein
MTRHAERMTLPPQARKLVDQHARAIESAAQEATGGVTSAASALSAACEVLNLRMRYFAATGEHFSVQEYEGIQVLDALDERLLKGIRELLQAFADRSRHKPNLQASSLLTEKLASGMSEIPQYPVGYMIHYMILTSIQSFEPLTEEPRPCELEDLEVAMVHHLLGILDRYVQTREKPVLRHFSDVAREYSVVMRLKCGCGAEKYGVKLQALCQSAGGDPFDRLDLQCSDCGAQRSITFDLPHFKDMYQI